MLLRVLRLIGCCLAPLLGSLRAAVPAELLLVAGEPSHGPGEHRFPEGCAALADALNQAGVGVRATVIREWPSDAELERAVAIVLYSDGLDRHVAAGHEPALRRFVGRGGGLSVLHFALEPNPGELADLLLSAIGGRFEVDWSVNPVWTPQRLQVSSAEVARGVRPFELEDEWYYHLRFAHGIVPVLQAVPPISSLGEDGPRSGNRTLRAELASGKPQTIAWTYERPGGGRSFGFTGGHFHRNWAQEGFRRLVLNAIVWTAHLDVPADGVPTSIKPQPRYATLEEAIARGDLADVRLHVEQGGEAAVVGRSPGMSPLHQAILRNRTEIALFLLEAGAPVDAPDRSQRTPLHLAVERGNAPLVKALAQRGAKLNERDKIGWTPLHHAAAKNQMAIALLLLDAGADGNTRSERGGTALHEAAASGSAEMVRLLLARGVDATVVATAGVTALDIAREFKNEPAITELERIHAPAAKPAP